MLERAARRTGGSRRSTRAAREDWEQSEAQDGANGETDDCRDGHVSVRRFEWPANTTSLTRRR